MKYKKHLITSVKLLISAALIWFLLQSIEIGSITILLERIPIWMVLVLVVVSVARMYIATFRYQKLLTTVKYVPFKKLLSHYFIASFYNNILPSVIGGDVYRVHALRNEDISLSSRAVIVVVERILGLYSLVLIAAFSAFFWHVPRLVLFMSFAFFIGFTLLLVVLMFGKLSIGLKGERWKTVNESINTIRLNKYVVLQALLWSLLFQLLSVLISVLVGLGIGCELLPVAYFTLVPLVWLFTMIPISFGGLGLREVSFVYLFKLVSVEEQDAFVISLGTYLSLIFIGLLGALVLIRVQLKQLNHE